MLIPMEIDAILEFLKEADRLKKVERQALVHSGGRHENSAEHSWHLALAALAFEKLAPEKIDILKVLKMALLHDIVEIDAGDTIVYAENKDKKITELKALERIMGILPSEIRDEFKNVWNEFELGESPEAKYVSAIDRFLPIYSNILNEGYSWKNHQISLERVNQRCEKPISEGLPLLWLKTKELLSMALKRGHIRANST